MLPQIIPYFGRLERDDAAPPVIRQVGGLKAVILVVVNGELAGAQKRNETDVRADNCYVG
jgi:hypothetical protein